MTPLSVSASFTVEGEIDPEDEPSAISGATPRSADGSDDSYDTTRSSVTAVTRRITPIADNAEFVIDDPGPRPATLDTEKDPQPDPLRQIKHSFEATENAFDKEVRMIKGIETATTVTTRNTTSLKGGEDDGHLKKEDKTRIPPSIVARWRKI